MLTEYVLVADNFLASLRGGIFVSSDQIVRNYVQGQWPVAEMHREFNKRFDKLDASVNDSDRKLEPRVANAEEMMDDMRKSLRCYVLVLVEYSQCTSEVERAMRKNE